MNLLFTFGAKMVKRGIAAFLLCAGSISAHADFSGDFAPSKWTASTQGWGCGSSSVDTSGAPVSIALLTSGNCADIGVWYEIAAPKTGSISFDWSMAAVSDGSGTHWAEYLVDGVGTSITSLPGGSSASGQTTLNVQAGQQITLHYKGRTGSRFEVSNFVFTSSAPMVAPAPVPVVGIPALIFGAFGMVGAAGFLSRRRRSA